VSAEAGGFIRKRELRERLGFDPCNLLGFYAGEHASASFFGYTFFCGKKRCKKDQESKNGTLMDKSNYN
jgi:hypothetical protein